MTNSPSNARFSWQKSRWTGSASVSGGTQGAIGYPWRMPAENYTRELQPPETRGRRGWIDMSAARPVSTSQQTGDGDVKPHQPSDEASQRGTEAQCHVGNDASEHTAETDVFGKRTTNGNRWVSPSTVLCCHSNRTAPPSHVWTAPSAQHCLSDAAKSQVIDNAPIPKCSVDRPSTRHRTGDDTIYCI